MQLVAVSLLSFSRVWSQGEIIFYITQCTNAKSIRECVNTLYVGLTSQQNGHPID